jgi:hypothetical protein
MSEMLERPTVSSEPDGTLSDFVGYDNLDLDNLEEMLAGLAAESSVPWHQVPVETPAESHAIPSIDEAPDRWTTTHLEHILTEEPDSVSGDTPAKLYRKDLRSSVEELGTTEEIAGIADNLELAAGEAIANGRYHSHVPGEMYAAECRLKRYAERLGPSTVKLVLVFETENRKEILDLESVTSGQEQARGSHEGGRGFGVIKQLTQGSIGKFGRYIKERLVESEETTADGQNTQEQRCAVWVAWASFSTVVDASSLELGE